MLCIFLYDIESNRSSCDSFSLIGSSFDSFLDIVNSMVRKSIGKMCWKKYGFQLEKKNVIYGEARHKISKRDIDLDQIRGDIIEKMPPQMSNGIQIVLDRALFYLQFIKAKFNLNNDCLNAFSLLKQKSSSIPI